MPALNTSIAIANNAIFISTSINSTSISSNIIVLAVIFLVILHNASIVLFYKCFSIPALTKVLVLLLDAGTSSVGDMLLFNAGIVLF